MRITYDKKTRVKRCLLLLLCWVAFLTGCGSTAQSEENAPRPGIFLHGTVYLEDGESVQNLDDGWKKTGVIKRKLANGQLLDESCGDYTANISSGKEGDEIYKNEAFQDRIYLKTDNETYAEYVKCYKPMIYVQDTLYVRESGYASGESVASLPEGWKRIGTIQNVTRQDEPMEKENFAGNDSTTMREGDEIYADAKNPNQICLKNSDNRYIVFVRYVK